MKNYLDKLPEEIFNKIMLYYNSHPIADLFKKEFEEELSEHYRIHKEGPGLEENWCEDDNFLFGYECLKRKLSDNNKELQMGKLRIRYWWRWPSRFVYLHGGKYIF